MSVMRINKTKNYTVMSNHHLRNKSLSLKAKGLLSVMLSLPDGWDYSIAGLCSICKENETAIKSALAELKDNGYVVVTKLLPDKDANRNRIEYVYDIFEQPVNFFDHQDICIQGIENLPLENLGVEIQGQLNTKESSTEKLNTEEKNNSSSTDDGYVNSAKQKLDGMRERFVQLCRERDDIDSDEQRGNVIKCYDYFMLEYRKRFKEPHLILANETLERVIDKFVEEIDLHYNHFSMPLALGYEDNEEIYKRVIGKYFETKFSKKTNYQIPHFISGDIIANIQYHLGNYS